MKLKNEDVKEVSKVKSTTLKGGFKPNKLEIFAVSASVLVAPCFAASTTLISTSGVDFMSVLNEMVALVPVVLPVIVGCTAFRKGIQFLKGAIKGA